uniref:Uncharacterized protein n=1 Tax=Arion vulgaris TaxID=1028688 RepID=A0A0B7B2W6_9EUPU
MWLWKARGNHHIIFPRNVMDQNKSPTNCGNFECKNNDSNRKARKHKEGNGKNAN